MKQNQYIFFDVALGKQVMTSHMGLGVNHSCGVNTPNMASVTWLSLTLQDIKGINAHEFSIC